MSPRVQNGLETSGPNSRRPVNAEPGDTYFDTTTGALLFWSGSAWVSAAAGGAGGGGLSIGNWVVSAQVSHARTVSFVVSDALGVATNSPSILIYIAGDSAGTVQVEGVSASGEIAVVAGTNYFPVGCLGLGHWKPNGSGVVSLTISVGLSPETYYLVVLLPGQPLAISPAIALT